MTRWAIVTGEYAPTLGGVAHYTRLVARGLAEAGDVVHVLSPQREAPELARDPGVEVYALPDVWGPRGLVVATDVLARARPTRLLVQYVPHVFGMKGMNVPFAAWLAARSEPTWVLFHEVAFEVKARQPLRQNVLGVVEHAMAALVSARAARIFGSIPEWEAQLRRANPFARPLEWLPIPSTMPTSVAPGAAALVRARHGIAPDATVVGYFGTLGPRIGEMVEAALVALGDDPARVLLVLGPRGPELGARLAPKVRARVVTPGALDEDDVAAHVAACSLMIAPYGDGVSTRRTSTMASLALGVPVVTNDGPLTQPVWRDGAVALARDPSAGSLASAAAPFLADPAARAALGRRGKALYEARFALARTIETLRGAPSATVRAAE